MNHKPKAPKMNEENNPLIDDRIEKATLGLLLANSEMSTGAVVDFGLAPEWFYYPIHQSICRQILEYAAENKGIVDGLLLNNRLRQLGIDKDLPSPMYLMDMAESAPFHLQAPSYFEKLRAMYNRRLVIKTAEMVIKDAEESTDNDFLMTVPQKFHNLIPRAKEEHDMGAVMRESIKKFRDIQSGERKMKGLSTGIADLDKKIGGIRPGSFYVIAARPSAGKTTLAGQIAQHFLDEERPVGWVNMDMPYEDLYERNMSRFAEVSLAKLSAPENYGVKYSGEKDFNKLEEAVDEMEKQPIHWLHGEFNVDKICSWARIQKQRHGIQLLVVDFIQKCKAPATNSSEAVRVIGYASAAIKEMCQQEGLAVLVLAQLSRGNVKDKRAPTLADIKACGNLEEDAQCVILLYKEERFDYDTAGVNEKKERAIWLDVAKQQNGGTGRDPYWLYAPYFKMSRAQEHWGHTEALPQ